MNEFFKSLIQKFSPGCLTDSGVKAGNSESREVSTPSMREAATSKLPVMDSMACPYCLSNNFQKRGFRQKKHERVQLYLCLDCGKTFTPQITKGKHYPLAVMLDAISIYNLGYSLEETCRIVNQRIATKKSAFADLVRLTNLRNGWTDNLKPRLSLAPAFVNTQNELGVDPPGVKPGRHGLSIQPSKSAEPTPKSLYTMQIQPSTLSNWISETEPLCRYLLSSGGSEFPFVTEHASVVSRTLGSGNYGTPYRGSISPLASTFGGDGLSTFIISPKVSSATPLLDYQSKPSSAKLSSINSKEQNV